MTKTIDALKLAEEALEGWKEYDTWTDQQMWNDDDEEALDSIREALAEKERQEPVGFITQKLMPGFGWRKDVVFIKHVEVGTALYAAPVSAKREWVELTDDEIDIIEQQVYCRTTQKGRPLGVYAVELVRAVIAAFKEKNK